jgi:hypothetical protein
VHGKTDLNPAFALRLKISEPFRAPGVTSLRDEQIE